MFTKLCLFALRHHPKKFVILSVNMANENQTCQVTAIKKSNHYFITHPTYIKSQFTNRTSKISQCSLIFEILHYIHYSPYFVHFINNLLNENFTCKYNHKKKITIQPNHQLTKFTICETQPIRS